jgi:hypothetical protein
MEAIPCVKAILRSGRPDPTDEILGTSEPWINTTR